MKVFLRDLPYPSSSSLRCIGCHSSVLPKKQADEERGKIDEKEGHREVGWMYHRGEAEDRIFFFKKQGGYKGVT